MASLENALSILLVEYLQVQNYSEEFNKWFQEAPIPFGYKIDLLKRMLKDYTILNTNFPNFWDELFDLQKFRNLLAHSFFGIHGHQTGRGKKIDTDDFSFDIINEKLSRLKVLEDTVRYMYDCEIIGTIPPFSSDDFADGPI